MTLTLATRVLDGIPVLIYKLDGHRIEIHSVPTDQRELTEAYQQEAVGIIETFLSAAAISSISGQEAPATPSPRPPTPLNLSFWWLRTPDPRTPPLERENDSQQRRP